MVRISCILTIALAACASHSAGGVDASAGIRPPFTHGVSTLAGWAEGGYRDGPRAVNLFHNPVNVAYAPDGTVVVADFDNGKIRAIDAEGTATTVIAQQGFERPFGMVFAGGVLYVSTDDDPMNGHSPMSGTLWRIDIAGHTATPVAVSIGRPRSLASLADGRIAAADDLHHVIEVIDPSNGQVTPIAGMWDTIGFADGAGTAAKFANPYGLVQRSDGALIVCDFTNHKLRVVALDGTVTTLAGGDAGFAEGPLASAQFSHPQGIARAANDDLFITDLDNFRVRKISGSTITTIAGDGTAGYADADDPLAAKLTGLEGLAVKPDGSKVYVADGTRGEDIASNRIRQIDLTP